MTAGRPVRMLLLPLVTGYRPQPLQRARLPRVVKCVSHRASAQAAHENFGAATYLDDNKEVACVRAYVTDNVLA